MDTSAVQDWLDRYVAAWRANNAGPIAELFTEDALYSYRPWDSGDHAVRGRDAIVASWLEEPDEPTAWDAHFEPYATVGDERERTYHNAFLLHFAPDGRCVDFREFYMEEGK